MEFGFAADGMLDRVRLAIGSAILVSGASAVFRLLAPRLSAPRRHMLERLWARSVARALRLTIRFRGSEHVSTGTQYLVMPLHEGFIDVPTLLHLPLPLRFTVRDELVDLDVVGPLLIATDSIVVPDPPRTGDLRSMYRHIGRAIATGDSLVVFPQGSILGVEVGFEPGVAHLAKHFELPILPVVISGTHRVWAFPYAQTVRFGRPVQVTVLPPIAVSEITVDTLRETERQMKQIAIAESVAPARRYVPERDGWWNGYAFTIDPDYPDLVRRVARHRQRVADAGITNVDDLTRP